MPPRGTRRRTSVTFAVLGLALASVLSGCLGPTDTGPGEADPYASRPPKVGGDPDPGPIGTVTGDDDTATDTTDSASGTAT